MKFWIVTRTKCFSKMDEFRENGKYCDVDVAVGDVVFPCHRVLLASVSKYFDSIFNEHTQRSDQKVQLEGVSWKCFKNVLEFVYGNRKIVNSSNSFALLVASRLLIYDELEEYCVKHMEECIPEKHIFETCALAKSANKTGLYEATVGYMARKIDTLRLDKSFSELPYEVLEDVIKHPNMTISLDPALELIMKWKEKQYRGEDEVDSLLRVAFQRSISDNDDSLNKLKHDVTRLHVRVYDVQVTEAERSVAELIYNKSTDEWKRDEYVKNLRYEKNVVTNGHLFDLAVKYHDDYPELHVNHFYVKRKDNVYQTLTEPFIVPNYNYSLTAIQDTVYLYASFPLWYTCDFDVAKNSHLLSYNYDVNEWYSMPKPKYEVTCSSIASLNNLLYLIGGIPNDTDKCIAQCYDHRSPNWINLPRPFCPHEAGIACSYNGKIYVLGGDIPDDRKLEVYDPKAAKWEMLKLSPKMFCNLDCFVGYDDTLWAIDRWGRVERYDPNANYWLKSNVKQFLKMDLPKDEKIVDAFVY